MSATQQSSEDMRNVAIPGLIGISFLFATALFTYVVRIWTRIRSTFQLSLIDYIITVAMFGELVVLVCLFKAIHLGLGYPMSTISPDTLVLILKYFFPLGLFGFWVSSLARVSIGGMLLRFEISKAWKVVIWIAIVVQLCMPIAANVFMLLQCRPIRALWEPVPTAVCWSTATSQSFGYIYSVVGITSDILFAIMPMFFIWTLHRPRLERVLISVLMGLGLIAAVAGGFKTYYIKFWDPRSEPTLQDWVPLFWWYRVEEISLIAAACAPFVKPLMGRILGRLGAPEFRFVTVRLNTVDSGTGPSSNGTQSKADQNVEVRIEAL